MTNDRQEVKLVARRVRNIEKRKERHVLQLMVYEDVLTFRSPDAYPTLRRRRSARHSALFLAALWSFASTEDIICVMPYLALKLSPT